MGIVIQARAYSVLLLLFLVVLPCSLAITIGDVKEGFSVIYCECIEAAPAWYFAALAVLLFPSTLYIFRSKFGFVPLAGYLAPAMIVAGLMGMGATMRGLFRYHSVPTALYISGLLFLASHLLDNPVPFLKLTLVVTVLGQMVNVARKRLGETELLNTVFAVLLVVTVSAIPVSIGVDATRVATGDHLRRARSFSLLVVSVACLSTAIIVAVG